MKSDWDKQFKNFSKTEKGKYMLYGMAMGIIMGILWKILFITVLIVGAGYFIMDYLKKEKPEVCKNGH